MKPLRIPGILTYAAMAMWLLQIAISPAGAEEFSSSRLADRKAEIRAALVAAGAPETIRVTLAAPDATIAVDPATPLAFDSVSYNRASGRYLIRTQIDGASVLIAGEAIAVATLPVLARALERNEIIGENDIDWIEVSDPRADLYIDDAERIIGKIARRPLAAKTPLRKLDIASPTLIKRGDTATIVLDAPGIRLTQAAIALASGGEGDVIAFRNVNSNREFKAVIVARGAAKAVFRAGSNVASLD
ncbi:MAG: flagellar basal body P-ring formation chaperone FlgA [Parvularculaceae bacterium]|nr:flagellar basal body P-ring formation protein FlgA [Parvularculaceae bacterium]